MPAVLLSPLAASAAGPAASPAKGQRAKVPLADLARGYEAYRAGDYGAATRALSAAVGHGLRVDDWALFFLGESEFYEGATPMVRGHFDVVPGGKRRPA